MQFNKLQQLAIDCKDPRIVVTAAPGSGKTRVIIGTIARYKEDHPQDKVVAITFTKKAAAELNLKLYDYPDVQTATIHSWSLRELKKLGAKHDFEVSLLQDEQIIEILKMVCHRLGYYSINYFMLFTYVMGNYNIDLFQGTKMKFEKILRSYIAYKRDNSLYDFTDLPLYLYDMLNRYHERITNIDALFVDEFQDVDDIQAQIFTMVDAKKHFYVGDEEQAIYIFRGADSSVLNNLDDFTHLKLNENYRSYQSILDFATTARNYDEVECIRELQDSWIEAVRKEEKGEVFMITEDEECYDFSEGSDLVKQANAYTVLDNFLEHRPYILCRSNKQVKEITKLGYNQVSTIHQAKGLEYPYVIVVSFATHGSEEETNILYVACTRAQNGLLVCDYNMLKAFLMENQEEYSEKLLF